jgi:histidine triad (HIT) family protein
MTIFSKIIQWDIPSYKICEDNKTYVFLDINQFHRWKLLIVPKIEVDHFYDLDDEYYQAIFSVAKRFAPIIKKVFHSERVALVIEWLEVPHVHIKIFPINKAWDVWCVDEMRLSNEEMLNIQQKIINESSI